ncbi:MAG: response regulator [Bacteroidales bacterium]|jgi:CheY-like chemotaxis protein/anti-sigma regulatory factor (Ser/Thr protein kinase)|nr:response regulator [Bacteroidales bacterium]
MYKILVIEDTADVRENIVEILQSENYEVFMAENGKIGIDLAQKTQPDLILCDIMMPEMDGYEVLELLRKRVSTSTTPFIFLTAKNTREDLRRGMALGADDYISKPFTIDELLGGIQTRLAKAVEFKVKSEEKLRELTKTMGQPITDVFGEPLKAIIGFSKMIMTEYSAMEKPEIAEFMSLIYNAGVKLNKSVHKTMMYYHLESLMYKTDDLDKLKNEYCYNFKEVVDSAAKSLAMNVGRSEDLLLLTDTDVPAKIPSQFLRSIIEEVLENACIYSPRGSRVKLVTGLDKNNVVLTISDEGIGMSQSNIEKIGAYTQFNKEFNRQDGLGLGLIIVKRILDIFGGQMTINSNPGVGSVIKLIIPAKN